MLRLLHDFPSRRTLSAAFSFTVFCAFALLLAPPLTQAQSFGDLVFANQDAAARVCQNNGAGGFSCSDVGGSPFNSSEVAAADFNGDGITDLAFARRPGTIGDPGVANRVCLGTGSGSFSCAALNDTNTSLSAAAADFDDDGNTDLVFANGTELVDDTGGEANRVCFGNGSGFFSSCSDVSTAADNSVDVAAADFNDDGVADLAFANTGFNRVCLSDGTGGFSCLNFDGPYSTIGVTAADLDGDGDADLAFANGGQNNRMCISTGSGFFSCSDVSSDMNGSGGVAAADFNDDGSTDLAFGNGRANRVCLRNGARSFSCSDISSNSDSSIGAVAADLNGDDQTDLVFSNLRQVNRTCLGDGSGSFSCSDVNSDANLSAGVVVGNFGGSVLPVELAGFTAQAVGTGGGVLLRWRTLSETRNAGFEVLHQADSGEAFEQIGYREGAGTTTEAQAYRFRAEDLAPGRHVFRLRQRDRDDTPTLSRTVEATVGVDEAGYALSVSPSPARGNATVTLAAGAAQTAAVALYDARGRRVRSLGQRTLDADEAVRIPIQTNGLASGLYVVRVVGEHFTATESLVIVR